MKKPRRPKTPKTPLTEMQHLAKELNENAFIRSVKAELRQLREAPLTRMRRIKITEAGRQDGGYIVMNLHTKHETLHTYEPRGAIPQWLAERGVILNEIYPGFPSWEGVIDWDSDLGFEFKMRWL